MKPPLTQAFFVRCCATLGLAFSGTSCRSQRHLIFESDPPGAEVFLDGVVMGRTPLDVRFESYGDRHVSIRRRGYRAFNTIMRVEIPWYSRFPLDYITEVFIPMGWEDIHRLEVTLEPRSGEVSQPDFEGLLERAESLRTGGLVGPNRPPKMPDEGANP